MAILKDERLRSQTDELAGLRGASARQLDQRVSVVVTTASATAVFRLQWPAPYSRSLRGDSKLRVRPQFTSSSSRVH